MCARSGRVCSKYVSSKWVCVCVRVVYVSSKCVSSKWPCVFEVGVFEVYEFKVGGCIRVVCVCVRGF